MHLITFIEANQARIGILDHQRGEVIDLSKVASHLPHNMLDFIAKGTTALDIARTALTANVGRIPLDRVRLLAPIPRVPRNIFCIGKNYREHVQELKGSGSACDDGDKNAMPEKPIFFTKATSSVIGPPCNMYMVIRSLMMSLHGAYNASTNNGFWVKAWMAFALWDRRSLPPM
jgi:2-keto-4-pentenoate hydratase/2-oxohepta-3-ene-1,7-dioic acid hydratase in catechol pathway